MVLKRITKKKQKQVKELMPTSFKFLSSVENPANEEAVDIIKSRENNIVEIEKRKKLAEMLDGENIAPVEFQFSKEFYETAEVVKAWLTDEGYEDFSVEENEGAYIVKADKELEVEAVKTSSIQREDGITVIVKEYDFSDLEENTIEEIKGIKKEEETASDKGDEAGEDEQSSADTEGTEVPTETEGQKEENAHGETEDVATETEPNKEGETSTTEEAELSEEVEGQKKESDVVLTCRGKNILEITKGMQKSLDYLKSVKEIKKEYSDTLGAYYGAETIAEALAIGGYDGGFPGMDEVMDTLEEFVKASLLRGDLTATQGAFDVAANYINGLKGLFDTYADSEILSMFTEKMMSADKVEEKAKSQATESLDNALLKEIHKELLVLNSSSDLQKSAKDDTVAKLAEMQESYSKDFTNLGDKLDGLSSLFEEFVSVEQTRVKSSLPTSFEVDNSGENQEARQFVLKDV